MLLILFNQSINGSVVVGQGGQSVAATGTGSAAAMVTTAQGGQSVVAAGSVEQVANVTTGQGSQSLTASGTVSQASSVTTGQGNQSVTASGTVAQGGEVAPVTPAITGGSSRARYPRLRITTPVRSEPITGRAATGQGGQRVTALGSAETVATVATSQGSQSITAQADSNNLRLLLAEDEFWLIAA